MSDRYVEYEIVSQSCESEIIIATLESIGVDSFWEDENLKFYVLKTRVDEIFLAQIQGIAKDLSLEIKDTELPDINWNQKWESDFKPVEVDDFCRIRASFHPPGRGFRYELIVDPKMAFGTGHHETTFMMIRQMEQLDFRDKRIWDFGTGTGILAILARLMGAPHVFANDNEEPAIENSITNAEINQVRGIEFRLGELDVVPLEKYDVVLANINRNVLLQTMPDIVSRLAQGGCILFSGILEADDAVMRKCFAKEGLTVETFSQKGEWLCYKCKAI